MIVSPSPSDSFHLHAFFIQSFIIPVSAVTSPQHMQVVSFFSTTAIIEATGICTHGPRWSAVPAQNRPIIRRIGRRSCPEANLLGHMNVDDGVVHENEHQTRRKEIHSSRAKGGVVFERVRLC
jgi:hypothetical protein